MVIAIDENLLITVITLLFIPIIGFVAKMFMQIRDNQSKIQEIDVMRGHISDLNKRLTALENEMSGLRVKIASIEEIMGRVRDYVLKNKDNINGFSNLIKKK